MIWIVGGTTEAVKVAARIKNNADYIVSVATPSGKEAFKDENVVVARLTEQEMIVFIKEHGIEKIVDLSHPYAVEVSKNAKKAARACDIPYIRYVRAMSDVQGAVVINEMPALLTYLEVIKGCVFFTTGANDIHQFEKVKAGNRFVYRILPAPFSIQKAADSGVAMEDIIAIKGPLSKALNAAMFTNYGADYVVMKNSGTEGGTAEKIAACRENGIVPVVWNRQVENGVYCLETLVEKYIFKKRY